MEQLTIEENELFVVCFETKKKREQHEASKS